MVFKWGQKKLVLHLWKPQSIKLCTVFYPRFKLAHGKRELNIHVHCNCDTWNASSTDSQLIHVFKRDNKPLILIKLYHSQCCRHYALGYRSGEWPFASNLGRRTSLDRTQSFQCQHTDSCVLPMDLFYTPSTIYVVITLEKRHRPPLESSAPCRVHVCETCPLVYGLMYDNDVVYT